jgi:alpha-amylase
LIQQTKDKLKITFHISGTSLDQFLIYAPNILNSFKQLSDTGQVEFTGGTASHSIASLINKHDEFKRQIALNREKIEYYFGQKPQVFVNSDLLFTNKITDIVTETGYPAILTNGAKKMLQWRSPNFLYSGKDRNKIKILFRNEAISNEFSLLLNNPGHLEKLEQLEQFFAILHNIKPDEPLVNIYINSIVPGGIGTDDKLQFFKIFVSKIIKEQTFSFSLPSIIAEQYSSVAEVGSDEPVCWVEHFNSSWFPGNELQKEAMKQLLKLENKINKTQNPNLKSDWQYLQTSDHFQLMDENHPEYHTSNNQTINTSMYDAFINFMNIVEDFRQRLKEDGINQKSKKLFKKSDSSLANL